MALLGNEGLNLWGFIASTLDVVTRPGQALACIRSRCLAIVCHIAPTLQHADPQPGDCRLGASLPALCHQPQLRLKPLPQPAGQQVGLLAHSAGHVLVPSRMQAWDCWHSPLLTPVMFPGPGNAANTLATATATAEASASG